LIGLDGLILKEKEDYRYTGNILYLSRTGIVKSNDQYFMIRRNIQAYPHRQHSTLNFRKQHFRIFEIKKDQAYIFWENSEPNMEEFYINADKNKYFQLKKDGKFFIQEWAWPSYETHGYQNYVFSAQEIFTNEQLHTTFQNDNEIDEKNVRSFDEQETTANTTPRNQNLENHRNILNEFVRSEKIKYDFEKKLKKKNEKELKEKYERELHQFSILRKVLISIIFDEEEACESPKKIFSDEEEKEFTKLYETALPANLNDNEDIADGAKKISSYREIFNNEKF